MSRYNDPLRTTMLTIMGGMYAVYEYRNNNLVTSLAATVVTLFLGARTVHLITSGEASMNPSAFDAEQAIRRQLEAEQEEQPAPQRRMAP